ncbi:hypothetical protein [Mariniblastus fucicola]|uniref:hypothetical protein n=1 Tax=Mariniblastus fucicola TaxID=980251 RepID=UPI0012FBDC76|nr:hypothetical protein [Mariniblastus fucicola]
MNRQFPRLLTSLILLMTFGFLGCDLGTYNKRFKERNRPAPESPAGDDAESDDSGDS